MYCGLSSRHFFHSPSAMKLLELRPPRERLTSSISSVKHFLKPTPQPAVSVTVESPASTILTFPAPSLGASAAAKVVRPFSANRNASATIQRERFSMAASFVKKTAAQNDK